MKLLNKLLPVLLIVAMVLPGVSPAYADTAYTVQPGDTLSKISARFGVSISAIMAANSLTNPNFIYVGQRLIIPGASVSSAPTAPATATAYVVQSGDTLSRISARFGVSQAALMAANGIANANFIYVGQRLTIPGAGGNPAPTTVGPAAPPAATVPPSAPGGAYVVQSGDTLYKIAQKFGVTFQALVAANSISNPSLIYVGQRLVIPGGGSAPATPTTPPTAPPATLLPTATPVPTAVVVMPANTPVPGGYWSRGIHGDSFSIATSGSVNEQIWFDFQVTNNTDLDISYGMMSAHTDVGPTGKSSSSTFLRAHKVLAWHDHMQFPSAGTYQVYLGICYDDAATCSSGSRTWDRLSNSITVTIH